MKNRVYATKNGRWSLLTFIALVVVGLVWVLSLTPTAFGALADEAAAAKTVSGMVETNDGTPVMDARILATRLDHPSVHNTLSAADGSYSLNLAPGLWSLTVKHTDSTTPDEWLYPKSPQHVHFDNDAEAESKVIDFTVLTADANVIGVVTMPDGSVPGFTVTVKLHTSEGHSAISLIDPVDGSFDIAVPHGNYLLRVVPEDMGYAGPLPEKVYVPLGDTLDAETLALVARDATIGGTVSDESGTGVAGVVVAAWTGEYQSAHTETAADGTYSLAVVGGDWMVKPHVPAELPYIYAGEAIELSLASTETAQFVDFGLTNADNMIVGQLVDENGDAVSAEGWVGAGTDDGPVKGAPIIDGAFQIYVPDGTYKVKANLAPGSEWIVGKPPSTTLTDGETVSVDIPVLPQDATIVAALWDPRTETFVTGVRGYAVATNPWARVGKPINPSNGTVRLPVSAGLWHVGYGVEPASGYVVLDHHSVLPLEAGETLGKALKVTKRDSWILGRVIDPNGQPVAGAVVVASGVGHFVDEVVLRTHTDETGHFRLHVPHGLYRLRAATDNDEWLAPVMRWVRAPEGAANESNLLQFRESDVTLSGAVTLEDAAKIVDGNIHIWAYTRDGAATHTAVALGDDYELGLLKNSPWWIGAVYETSDSFYAIRSQVRMTTTDQVVDLVLAGPFPKPGPVVTTFDSAEPQTITLADGTSIDIPAAAMPVSGLVTLHITPIATMPHQHYARLYKYGYAFIATDESGDIITENFNSNVTISFSYDEDDLADLDLNEARLKPAYFSTTTNSWTVPDNYVVDTTANRVSLDIDHFTDYSLLNGEVDYQISLPLLAK